MKVVSIIYQYISLELTSSSTNAQPNHSDLRHFDSSASNSSSSSLELTIYSSNAACNASNSACFSSNVTILEHKQRLDAILPDEGKQQ